MTSCTFRLYLDHHPREITYCFPPSVFRSPPPRSFPLITLSKIPNLPRNYLLRSRSSKSDQEFEVILGQEKCASDIGQTLVYNEY